jgi:hypothetical protein
MVEIPSCRYIEYWQSNGNGRNTSRLVLSTYVKPNSIDYVEDTFFSMICEPQLANTFWGIQLFFAGPWLYCSFEIDDTD